MGGRQEGTGGWFHRRKGPVVLPQRRGRWAGAGERLPPFEGGDVSGGSASKGSDKVETTPSKTDKNKSEIGRKRLPIREGRGEEA